MLKQAESFECLEKIDVFLHLNLIWSFAKNLNNIVIDDYHAIITNSLKIIKTNI